MYTMKRNILILSLLSGWMLTGCNKNLYHPNMQNIANITGKKDLNVQVSPSNIQVAYGATRSMFLVTNVQFQANQFTAWEEDAAPIFKGRRMLAEAGVGYYKNIDEKLGFESAVGYGYGQNVLSEEVFIQNGSFQKDYRNQFNRIYWQSALVLRPWKWAEFGFSLRTVAIDYHGVYSNEFSFNELDNRNLLDVNLKPHIFAEPAFTMRWGKKRVQLHHQFQWTYKITNQPINHQVFQYNVGLTIKLRKKLPANSVTL